MSNVLARGRPVEVLLVEDNPDDVELMRIGFHRAKFAVNLHHAGDGEACMAFLRREAPYTDAPRPDLILLDLNMPRMDGREVLAEIDKDEALSQIPVVVLTSSDADSDVLASYRLSCSSYIVKPVDFEQFSRVVRGIGDYWFTLVVLPPDA